MATQRSPAPPAAAKDGPIVFTLPGQRELPAQAVRGGGETLNGAAGAAPAALPGGLAHGTLVHSVRVQAQRSGAAGAGTVRVEALPGRDVVVLRLSSGPALVLHPESARRLMLAQQDARAATRGLPDTAVDVPTVLRWRGLEAAAGPAPAATATRGGGLAALGEVLLSGFDVVRDAVLGKLAEAGAQTLAEHLDGQVVPGVYALPRRGRLTRFKGSGSVPLDELPGGDKPLLVFIHGTFSNSAGAFGDLWAQHPQRVAALFEHYGERLFALDHRTLGESPVANALALVQRLPAGARLHLVTHSRGGLVAEVLARVAGNPSLDGDDTLPAPEDIEDGDERAAALAQTERDRKALAQIGKLIKQRNIRIERIVRVACPSRGTLLASKRLDAYLSVFKWLLQMAGAPVLPELVEFLSAVAQQGRKPGEFPGLAAQVPDSALVRWLHAGAKPVPGQLRVIAGDVEGDSPLAWVKTLLADGFYWTDNDFVVHTRAMYGGAPREGGASFLLDRGGEVSHLAYFRHPRTAEAVCNALLHEAPEGFRPIGPLSWRGDDSGGLRGARRRGAEDARAPSERPAVIVLPGILGSNIKVDDHRVWLALRMVGGLERLAYPDGERKCVADGAISLVYDALMEHLSASHEVIEFAFDWRLPLEQEAKRLAGVVREALAARQSSHQPVRFVAHSMGGLLLRAMALEEPATWKLLLARDGARVLMLGTPNGGSWAPMQVLSGDDTFGNTLVAFGSPFGDHKARQMMAQFPGFLQLQADLLDGPKGLEREERWQQLADDDLRAVQQYNWWHSEGIQLAPYKWGVPAQAVLDQAIALRKRLDAQRDNELPAYADRLLLVVGRSRFTPDGFEMGSQGLEYLDAEDGGDGRVTLGSARLPGVRAWQVDCEHGALPSHADAFAAYTELLVEGRTAQLKPLQDSETLRGGPAPAAPAPHRRSRPARRPRSLRPPASEAEAMLLAPEEAAAPAQRAAAGAISIEVTNANLMFMRPPLLVGHYRATRLSGAGSVVDYLLDGALATALRAGIYPQSAGEQMIFRNASKGDNPLQMPRPEYAIVVGLGDESELKGSKLLDTVRTGLIAWARHESERSGGAPAALSLATTLIGSGGTGITPGQSAQMVARAAFEANQVLAACHWPLIASLEFVELYLDRATEAWRALRLLASGAPDRWRISDEVQRGSGALRRSLDAGYRGADYDLISAQVVGSGIGAQIAYTLDTRRARSEVRAQMTQPRLLREMVARNSNAQEQDQNIGFTLYQLLIPVEMDAFFWGSTEMRLELDAGTAGIPWELLRHQGDRDDSAEGPWAVRTKLLRKLRTSEFRTQVRDATHEASVLVIGEPATPPPRKDRPGDLDFPRLQGARNEARQVVQCLEDRLPEGSVVPLIADDDAASQPDAHRIVGTLLQRDWRVVHIAGHGLPPLLAEGENEAHHDDGTPARVLDPRGVVLSTGYLGPAEIRAMRTVPELVFVNCCHGAERDKAQLFANRMESRAEFASTVADELIKIGVRCVVAAGWAVEDEPAGAFAREFYTALAGGERFIDATARARKAAWAARGSGNTWAAYQCYGDPDWVLTTGSTRGPGRSLRERYGNVSSAVALELALDTVAVESKHIRGRGADRERQKQRRHLDYLESSFAARWGHHGFVAVQFALSWEALGDIDKAIAWYARAVKAQDGTAPRYALAKLHNLRVRKAEDEVRLAATELCKVRSRLAPREARAVRGGRDYSADPALKKVDELRQALEKAADAARDSIHEALEQLAAQLDADATMEQHVMVGSSWKRLALIEHELDRRDAARAATLRMRSAYDKGWGVARTGALSEMYYAGLNLLLTRLVLWNTSDFVGPLQEPPMDAMVVDEVRASIEAKTRDDADFWSVSSRVELMLLEALVNGELVKTASAVAGEFSDLQRRISTPSDWASVFDSIRFVLDRWAENADENEQKVCVDLVQQLAGYAWPPGV